MPLEKWVELENEVYEQSGLQASIFDADGIRITDNKQWANRLCPAIKATDKGQSFICAVAHMNVAAQAKRLQKPVIEECDAGLVKLAVPIFVGGEFVGAFAACGLRMEDAEVDSFLVHKVAGIDEENVKSLSGDIAAISTSELNSLIDLITARIEAALSEYNRAGS